MDVRMWQQKASRQLKIKTIITELFQKFLDNLYIPERDLRTEKDNEEIRQKLKVDPKSCDHLKGFGPKLQAAGLDYNVSLHTFIDGTKRIRCNNCGKKWFKEDIDWEEALKMTEQSTNHPSSSETVPNIPIKKVREEKGGPYGRDEESSEVKKYNKEFYDRMGI